MRRANAKRICGVVPHAVFFRSQVRRPIESAAFSHKVALFLPGPALAVARNELLLEESAWKIGHKTCQVRVRRQESALNLDGPEFQQTERKACSDSALVAATGVVSNPPIFFKTCVFAHIHAHIYPPPFWKKKKLPATPLAAEILPNKIAHSLTKVVIFARASCLQLCM